MEVERINNDIPAIDMRHITKRFGTFEANSDIDLNVYCGEIHALLGENGAGKSTLMNVLYGLYKPDEGEIYLHGDKITLSSPADAINNKIGMIHQHFMLIPTLTVVENIILMTKTESKLHLNLKNECYRLMKIIQKYGFEIDLMARVADLSVGEQQKVEILKMLYRGAEVLIMDEPTAVLSPNEVEDLFKILREIVDNGCAVIFISHKLWEVMRISDRATILRDGKKITTVNTSECTKEDLANMMVGREITLHYEKPETKVGKPVLQLKNVYADNDHGVSVLKNINLTVNQGEILGVAGVDGNGQQELADIIHGMRKVCSGTIKIAEVDTTNCKPQTAIDSGLAHIPEDRHKRGSILEFSVTENIAMINVDKAPFTHKGIYYPQKAQKVASGLKESFNIKCTSVNAEMSTLSGGNQQKVVLAREIYRNPKMLIAAQPSRGLDIGATESIQQLLIDKRTEGMAILLISSDLDEILAISDRVIVIYEGEIQGEFIPGEKTFMEIGLMMTGSSKEERNITQYDVH